MKKRAKVMWHFITMSIILFSPQWANADFTQIPDLAFRACLNELAIEHNWSKPEEFTSIVCHNKNIKSVEGLESFDAISKLSLYKNKLTQINLPALPKLEHLNLAGNQLENLKLYNLPVLSDVFVFKNKLDSLSITNLPALEKLKANNNKMTHIQFSNSTSLKKLYIFDNNLEIVDMKDIPSLTYIDARHNPMPSEFYDYLDSLKSLTARHDGNAEDWQ